jgi:DUF1009 family protein
MAAIAENAPGNWGLIAGNGDFPFLVLEGARSRGIEMAVIAIREEASPALQRAAAASTGSASANSAAASNCCTKRE